MASRTNKMWILKKKKQLEKIKAIKWASSSRVVKNRSLSEPEKLDLWLVFDLENPKWKKYTRDKSWRKVICKQTGLREDMDGYRLLFKPNSSELIYKFSGFNARLNRRMKKAKI